MLHREHYKDKASGELKPSKKGLALSAEQWDTLSKALPELSDAFKVHDIPEPADIITPASVPKGSSMLTVSPIELKQRCYALFAMLEPDRRDSLQCKLASSVSDVCQLSARRAETPALS